VSDATLFERRRAPLNAKRVSFAGGLMTLVGVGAFLLSASPFAATMTAILGGVFTMTFGLAAMDQAAYGGRLHRLRRQLRLVSRPAARGYRDRPPGPELWVDAEALPKASAREVLVGHYASQDFDFFPLYLVFDDRVVELDVFRDRAQALAAQETLAERVDLPAGESPTGLFGMGTSQGCLVGAATVTAQLAAIAAGGIGSLFVEGPTLRMLLPTLMVLALWAIAGVAARIGAKRVRPRIDEEVRHTFALAGPRVRVAPDVPATPQMEHEPAPATAEGGDHAEQERSP